MFNLLTSFAPIKGDWGLMQQVAAYSFSLLQDCKVFVLGNDDGASQICQQYGFIHIPNVKVGKDIGVSTSNGIVLGDAFEKVKEQINEGVVLFINGDNVIVPSVLYSDNSSIDESFQKMNDYFKGDFCGWGRRNEVYDYNNLKQIQSIEKSYEYTVKLFEEKKSKRIQYGIDLYIWSYSAFNKMELLSVLIDGWHYDNWLGHVPYQLSKNVVYLTDIIETIHYQHPESSNRQQNEARESTLYNKKLIQQYFPNLDIFKLKTPKTFKEIIDVR